MNVYSASLMLTIAIVAIYFAVYHYYKTQDLLRNGIVAKAKVVSLIEKRTRDGSTYQPVFEFLNRETNEVLTYHHIASSSTPRYRVGETGYVVFSQDLKQKKLISFYGLFQWTIVLLIVASPLLILGGGYLMYLKL